MGLSRRGGRRADNPFWGLFGLGSFGPRLTPEQRAEKAKRDAAEKAAFEKRIRDEAIPWDTKTWQPVWFVKAKTYAPGVNLFPELLPAPMKSRPASDSRRGLAGWLAGVPPEYMVVSPTGRFIYINQLLPAYTGLHAYRGNRKGTVYFDGPVVIPTVYEVTREKAPPPQPRHVDPAVKRGPTLKATLGPAVPAFPGGTAPGPKHVARKVYDSSITHATLWMSLTPQEMVTLAPGTRKAKGTVVIGGLGLGHQLIEVCQKRSVKKIILLERSKELVDWLRPRIRPHLSGCKLEVIIGDAGTKTGKTIEALDIVRENLTTWREEYLTINPRTVLGREIVASAKARWKSRRNKHAHQKFSMRYARLVKGNFSYRGCKLRSVDETLLLKVGNRRNVDVVLVDIFPAYGNNNDRMNYVAPTGGRREGVTWWAWGGAAI